MRNYIPYFWLVMSLAYIGLGLLLIVRLPDMVPRAVFDIHWTHFEKNPTHLTYLAGGLLITYGLYRFIRTWKRIQNKE